MIFESVQFSKDQVLAYYASFGTRLHHVLCHIDQAWVLRHEQDGIVMLGQRSLRSTSLRLNAPNGYQKERACSSHAPLA